MDGHVELYGYRVNLIDELGRGAFGTVYKGHDENDQMVAVKKVSKINRQVASIEAIRFHYLKERIDHENIVKVIDVKTWKDAMWIIMEYCDGNLKDLFREGYLNVATAETIPFILNLMRDIAEGVAFLHTMGIIHRDLKPENVLTKKLYHPPFHHSPIAKLGDFGLSKILDPDDLTSAMSSDVGTTSYKAPEFWDQQPTEDGAAQNREHKLRYHKNVDVFATGLIFSTMLQPNPDPNMIPRAVCKLKPSETNMAIGLIGFTRQSDVQVFENQIDDRRLKTLENVIRDMTRFSADQRIAAATVIQLLDYHNI